MGHGLCSRCPKVGRDGREGRPEPNEKAPSHPSYCRVCIREYNQDRYRKQTALKDFITVMSTRWSEMALALADNPPNWEYARTLTQGALHDLKDMGEGLQGVGRKPVVDGADGAVGGKSRTPSLKDLLEQMNKIAPFQREHFKQNVIEKYYPDAFKTEED